MESRSASEPPLDLSGPVQDWLPRVAEAVGLGSWNYLPNTGEVYWSDRTKEIFGVSPSKQVTYEEFLRSVHVLDRQRVNEAVQACLDPTLRLPYDIEYRILRPESRVRWVWAKGQAFFDTGNKKTRMAGTVLDVTSHRNVEGRLEAIVKSANDAVITIDLQGRIADWNPSATRVYGYTREEMLGRTIDITVPPDRLQESRTIFERARCGEAVSSVQTQRVRKDGGPIHVLLTVSPIFDSEGQVLGISGVVKDITEQLASEEQLRQAKRIEAIGLLAGGIAHDFNNLLTVMNGYAIRLLDQCPANDPTRRQLLSIEEAGKRAQSLTQQLLAFSRRQVLQPRVVTLSEVIAGLVPLLGRLIREDVEILTTFSCGAARILIDQSQLEQVLLNLAVNASDAMPAGGKLAIETHRIVIMEDLAEAGLPKGNYVLMVVSDTGCGISAEVLPHIFDPFFTTKPVGKGTGLGLASVHGIVKQSGGHIVAASEVGRGTTIKVYLPESIAEISPSLVVENSAANHPSKGTGTILLVEDDLLLRQYAIEVLSEGYTVIEASNGTEALILSETIADIDLVITDVVMPAMSGRELVGKLRAKWPSLRALYMSGYAENAITQIAVLNPSEHYLPKPFSPSQLNQKVGEILAPARSESKHILIVDDDTAVREVLACALKASGYTVLEAADGASALNCRRDQAVDLVLLDLVMPGQEGFETLRQLKRLDPQCPIMVMSGHDEYFAPARALGAAGTLQKPIKADRLIQSVDRLIR